VIVNGAAGWVILMVDCFAHPFKSVAVTVYEPAESELMSSVVCPSGDQE